MKVEMIYDDDCPNADGARRLLAEAVASVGRNADWEEHCRQDPAAPAYAQDWGSPTMLVDGQDVAPSAGGGANACRIYRDEDGRMSGLPPQARVLEALGAGAHKSTSGTFGQTTAFMSVFAGLAGFLPVVSCAACWPAYAALLEGLGISFVDYTPYVFPLMAVGLFGLYHGACLRRGMWPFAIGVLAAIVIFVGRFVLRPEAALYLGTAIFIVASVWNSYPRRKRISSGVANAGLSFQRLCRWR